MSYIEANKNTEQRTVIQMYCLQHAQANKSCDYNDDFYRAGIEISLFASGISLVKSNNDILLFYYILCICHYLFFNF